MTAEKNWVEEIGAPAYASIAEMVAALECDYDRLEELRDERDGWERTTDDDGNPTGPDTWADDCADDADELKELEAAAGECKDADEARERIEEDALSVEVRSGWTSLGEPLAAEEFAILLTTGGPAVRIMGELDNGEPCRAWLEVQDWGRPWTQYIPADGDTLLTYARVFCFES